MTPIACVDRRLSRFSTAGSLPSRRRHFALVAASRASATPTEGYGPIESSLSLRLNSYLRRHSSPPGGVTQTCNPPPSVSLCGLSAALALRAWTSVSIGAPQNARPRQYDTPQRTRILV